MLRDLCAQINGNRPATGGTKWSQRSPAGLVTPSARSSLGAAWRADLGPGEPGSWGPWDGLGVLGCSGSPVMVLDPGRSWDLRDPEIWGILG